MRIRKNNYPLRASSAANASLSDSHGQAVTGSEALDLIQQPEQGVEGFEALEKWKNGEDSTDFIRVRWPDSQLPLVVLIESESQGDTGMARFIYSVVREWEAASGGLIRFVQLDSPPAKAGNESILLTWTDETTLGREFEVGHAKRSVNGNNEITHVEITLLREPAIDKSLNGPEQMNRLRATILHEFGHALGLEHSSNPHSVMHHQGWKNHFLSPDDIQALRLLYSKK